MQLLVQLLVPVLVLVLVMVMVALMNFSASMPLRRDLMDPELEIGSCQDLHRQSFIRRMFRLRLGLRWQEHRRQQRMERWMERRPRIHEPGYMTLAGPEGLILHRRNKKTHPSHHLRYPNPQGRLLVGPPPGLC